MNIRNEILINKKLSELVNMKVRTYGIRFKDTVWAHANTAVIFHRKIPFKKILNLYANIQSFNVLNDRYDKIRHDKDYINKDNCLPTEHAEMVKIAEDIERDTKIILIRLKV